MNSTLGSVVPLAMFYIFFCFPCFNSYLYVLYFLFVYIGRSYLHDSYVKESMYVCDYQQAWRKWTITSSACTWFFFSAHMVHPARGLETFILMCWQQKMYYPTKNYIRRKYCWMQVQSQSFHYWSFLFIRIILFSTAIDSLH